MIKQIFYAFFLLFSVAHISCTESAKNDKKPDITNIEQKKGQKNTEAHAQTDDSTQPNSADSKIPAKVYQVLQYVKEHGEAMPGYVGGRVFQNREQQLAMKDNLGKKIKYQEWDVNPKKNGVNRGAERLVTGSDNRAWYTNNHYQTFGEVK